MLYTLRFFSLQNAICFIMLTSLVPVLFTFYIQGVLKLKKNNSGAKGLNRFKIVLVLRGFDLQPNIRECNPVVKRDPTVFYWRAFVGFLHCINILQCKDIDRTKFMSLFSANKQISLLKRLDWPSQQVQGLSKRFERFKFGIFYVLIVKIRYNFTHK